MKRKVLSILFTLALVLGLTLVPGTVAAQGYSWSDDFDEGVPDQTWVEADHGMNSVDTLTNDRYQLHTETLPGTEGALVEYVDVASADCVVNAKVQQIAPGDRFLAYVIARADVSQNKFYCLGISSGDGSSNEPHLWLGKYEGTSFSNLGGAGGSVLPWGSGDYNWYDCYIKLSVLGDELKGKIWKVGEAEPSSWQVSATDSSITEAGVGGIMVATYTTLSWYTAQAAFDDVSFGVGEVTGQYEVSGAPAVTVTFTPTEMDPQVEQTVTVNVNVGDARTLEELGGVTFMLWYEGTPATPTEVTLIGKTADTQTCTIITWTPGGGFVIAPTGGDTTWSLGTCTPPTLTNSSGDFTLKFTPGKVATEADGATTKWQMAATATSVYGTGFGYDEQGTAMNWYGEMALGSTVNVDWGSVPPGLDFADSAPSQASLGTDITYISNGGFDKKAKSSATWVGATHNATLDSSGVCDESQEFALMADNAEGYSDAALLDSTGVSFDSTGSLTTETGSADENNYLWLNLASTFDPDVYSGTITYIIANNS